MNVKGAISGQADPGRLFEKAPILNSPLIFYSCIKMASENYPVRSHPETHMTKQGSPKVEGS